MNIFWLQRKKCINYLICISLLALLVVLVQNYFIPTKVYHYLYPKESLYCYRVCSNTLTDISEETPVKGKSIFFHETSCNSFFNGKTTITARQACAVESAAKMNPGMGVYLLFTSPGRLKFEGDESDDILKALLSYENVKLLHVNFDEYTKGTPVEELYRSGLLDDSGYAQSHASDVLRYLTLWKYGGIYLDLDVIVVRSLEELAYNYAGCESDINVAAGVMSFSPDGLGHQLARTCLEDLRDNFDGRDWGNNGPGVITRLLRRICGTQQAKDMITKDCQGFQVYPPDRFYAVPWTKWHMYFDENATRAIFDNEEHGEFKKKLQERIKQHDKDIERLCNVYYQGFIESVRELLEVRSHSNKLNNQVVGLDKQLHLAASNITKSGSELLQARKVQSNIAVVIAQLNLCLPVFLTYFKLQKQIAEKRYYPALKTLEELEHLHLPHVSNYRFSRQLQENIPKYREKIGEASMSDLKDFLENIRKFSPRIGEVAMRHTSEQLASDPTVIGRKKKRNAALPPGHSNEEDLSAQELIDFSPIYRGLHIAHILGRSPTFESYYRAERTKQARLVLQPPTNMHESEESYKAYIHAVLGFFILEDHVLNTGKGLITRAFLDDMWSMALSKIVTALQTHSAYCTDATLILKIKDLIMLFCATLKNYGYTIKPLWELVRELRDHYTEVLMQRWVQVFREILSKEDFQPIKVYDQEEFDNILLSFPWDGDLPDVVTFPYSFPFSSMVPKVYQQVKEFIYACLKFSEDLNLSQVEVDEMIRKSMNLLLTRTFSGCLSSTFRSPHVNLQEIIQIIVDTGYLEEANVYLDQFISNITGEDSRGLVAGVAQSQHAMFRVAREDAVRQICEKLKQKLNEFLELENYDWLLVEPTGHASSYISDMIAFLQTTFQSFTNIPPEAAQIACKSACEHIANFLLNLLLNEEIKQISMGVLNQLNLDLLQCEQFAASEPVEGLQDDLLTYFEKLREILDLFISWDWPTYFHDYAQETNKYKKVNPDVAIILLEKLKEGDKKTMFTVLKKSERDKKKLLETVLKQLRQLSQIPPGK